MNDPQQTPQPMQSPMMMPFIMQQPMMSNGNLSDAMAIPNVAPVRVDVAFGFVTYMRVRMTPHVAIDNMGNMQVEQPVPLTNAEKGAFDAACATLTDYFAGQLTMNELERQRCSANNFELTKRCPGRPIKCVKCHDGFGKPTCTMCHGSGKIIAAPYDENEPES